MRKSTTKSSDRSTWSSPNPTEPIIISRVPVYAPVSRPATTGKIIVGGKIETPWGWVEVSGPTLTWEHRRILLLAKIKAREEKGWEDGSHSLWIDAYKIKKELGYTNGGEDHRRFIQRLRDMKTANLKIYNNKTKRLTESSVVWAFSYDSEKTNIREKLGIFTTTRRPKGEKEGEVLGLSLYEIRISKEYMSLFAEDLRIHHAPDLARDLVQIKDGAIASIVFFFLSQKDACRYNIRQILEIVGAIKTGMSKGRISQIIKKVKLNKELERFGIHVETECLSYSRNTRVFFTKPPSKTSPKLALEVTLEGKV